MDIEYVLIPIIIALNEGIKKYLPINILGLTITKKFIPLFTIIFSILGCILLLDGYSLKEMVVQIIVVALSASGLYSGVKNVRQGFYKEDSDVTNY